ncbi:MAG TPA: carboxypeptidase-like regulatory domain-containing protein [Thermoanaerobaculia bacterium]|nr:carboxypeptidase-like regulatory domain-containing protein [Thermoanaerobaculia bacterium]
MKYVPATVLVCVLLASETLAEPPCYESYDAARPSITEAHLGRGLEMKLLTKVENAWRVYRSGKKNARKNALHELEAASGLLDRNSTEFLPNDVRDSVQKTIAAFRRCIEGNPIATGTLTVRVTRRDIETFGTKVVEGAIIRVNGEEVALTSSDGTAAVDVPAGQSTVHARYYPRLGASSMVEVLSGQATSVDLSLDSDYSHEDSSLIVEEAPEGVIPIAFTKFTLRFVDSTGTPIPMRSIEEITLEQPRERGYTHWPDKFAVASDGSIQAADIEAWRKQLAAQDGRLVVGVSAIDTRGRLHGGSFAFYLARYSLQGRLVPPPSNPALNVGDIPILVQPLNTDLAFRTASNADGSFSFPLLPGGNIEVSAERLVDGQLYTGLAVVTLRESTRVLVNMLHMTDKQNGVPLFRTERLSFSKALSIPVQTPPRDARTNVPPANAASVSAATSDPAA